MADTNGKEQAVVPVERRPTGLFEQIEREMEDLRQQMFGHFRRPVLEPFHPAGMQDIAWSPTADAYEQDGAFVVKAELPGVKKEDVKVSIHEGLLTIEGQRTEEKERKEARYYAAERFAGTFRRIFALPEGTDASKIAAEYKDGVLEVHVPIPAAAKAEPVNIPVKS